MAANPIKALLRRSQNSWLLLTQTTIWVAAALAAFLLPPPSGTPEDSQIWVRFAQFVITIVIGLLVLAAFRWQRRKDVSRWATLAVTFLLLGTAVFFTYQILASRWTANYAGQRTVFGGALTAYGREYQKENPHLTPEELIMGVAGKVERIWTRESMNERRLILAAVYVLAMPLFTVCIMSIVQALQCSVAKTANRKRSPARSKPTRETAQPSQPT